MHFPTALRLTRGRQFAGQLSAPIAPATAPYNVPMAVALPAGAPIPEMAGPVMASVVAVPYSSCPPTAVVLYPAAPLPCAPSETAADAWSESSPN